MNDFLGKPLEIGDEVVFIEPGYRSLKKGKIVKITKCFVFISEPNTWIKEKVVRREPQTVIKI